MWETIMMRKFPNIDPSVLKKNVGDQNAEQTTWQTAKSDPPELPGEPHWTSRRKAEPLNKLLGSTLQWAEALPPGVKPVALMAKYPRVANMVAARSKEGRAFYDYLAALLGDGRGGRKGFSSDLVGELEHLRAHYFYSGHKAESGKSIYHGYGGDLSQVLLAPLGPANRKRG
jgi:hypothetical protein